MIEKKKNSFLFDEIVSIVPVGKKQTYDFCIPVTHCFFANDVLCHNSGGIGESADTIILIDNLYRRNKTPENKGRIDLHIEQRYGDSGVIRLDSQLGICSFNDLQSQIIGNSQRDYYKHEEEDEGSFI